MPLNCHRCGALIPEDARFCSNCGGGVGSSARGMSLLKVLGAVCLGIICLPLGFLGGCLLIMTPFTLGSGIGGTFFMVLMAVVLLSLTVLGISQMARLLK